MAAAPDGQCPWLGGVQRHLRLCFGGLCAAVYLVAKTPAFALSWWLSGLSYDAMHGVGNFVIMLLLYRPLRRALQTAKRQIHLD